MDTLITLLFLLSSVLANSLVEVKSSPGKGLGVYALQDLEIGTIIIAESPIIRIKRPDFVKGTGYPIAAVSQLVRSGFDLLSPEEQEDVLSLTYHATEQEERTSDKLGLIFRSNAYKTDNDIGLFPKIARINHSCRPNTSYYWNSKQNKRIVYANRRIVKGEEVFDSYISLLLPQAGRQKLLEPYGFVCSCEACALDNEAWRESDQRRVDIKKAFRQLEPLLTLQTSVRTESEKLKAEEDAEESLRLVQLVELEGLADYYANAYKIAAKGHARVEDWAAATSWANKGYELRVMEDPDSPYAMEMYELTSGYIERWKHELRDKQFLKEDL